MKKKKRKLITQMLLCLAVSFAPVLVSAAETLTEYPVESVDAEKNNDLADSEPDEKALEEGFLEEGSERIDISSMVYQAGGWGTSAKEYMIQAFSIKDESALKAEIENALQNSETELDVRKYDLAVADKDDVARLVAEVINENPYLFYAEAGVSCYYSGGTITKLIFYYDDYSQEDKEAYAKKLTQAAELITPEMTDEEKALIMHDYLAQNCAYAYTEYLNGTLSQHLDVYKSYGALVEGRAVCNGYALAYDALLRVAGISSFTCSSREMNHAWNIIQIGDEWFHVDVTWDDPVWNKEGCAQHRYFLLSDDEILRRAHSGWTADQQCTSVKYDDYWWKGVHSQIVINGETRYYIVPAESGMGFQLEEKKGNSTSVKYSNQTCWEVWNGNGWWSGIYAYLSRQGDTIYFNDKKNLYAMKLNGSVPQIIYTYDGGDGYIYGAMVYGDGTARLNIDTEPYGEGDSYITIDLKDMAPALEADYTNRTLPTSTVMEYSLDNGTSWTRCTANMKLESFGWNGSREVSVLIRYSSESISGFAGKAARITLQTIPGTVGGLIKCQGSQKGPITVQMVNGDGKIIYETNADNKNEYVFQNVASGIYTMRISRPHYVTREYALTVGNQAVNFNPEIRLLGDTNGDGKIDAKDKKIIYSHISSPVLEGYDFLVGDVNNSGKIDARDMKIIYNHIAGSGLLW